MRSAPKRLLAVLESGLERLRDRHEWHPVVSALPLGRTVLTSVVDQNSPHHTRGQGEEMCPVERRLGLPIHETEVRFVDELCCRQSVALGLAPQLPVRNRTKLGVDER